MMPKKKKVRVDNKEGNGSGVNEEVTTTDPSKKNEKSEKKDSKYIPLWETDISKKSRSIIAFQILFPFLVVFLFFTILYHTLSWAMFSRLGAGSLLYFFPPAGKESLIPGMISENVNPYLVIIDIVFIDLIISIFLIWNFDYVKRVPFFGDMLKFIEKHGQKYLKEREFAKGGVYIMLILFVMVPFQGSGGAAATIIGKIIGMRPYRIWACVWAGSLMGVTLITKAALEAKESIGEDLIWVVVGIFAIAGIYAVISLIRGRMKEKNT